jgi:hypothetical protein
LQQIGDHQQRSLQRLVFEREFEIVGTPGREANFLWTIR